MSPPPPVAILAAEALTALGDSRQDTWRRLLAGESGIQPVGNDFGPHASAHVAGAIPGRLDAVLRHAAAAAPPPARGATDCPADAWRNTDPASLAQVRAYRMARWVGAAALRQASAAWDDNSHGAAGLVLGTCKGGLDACTARLAGDEGDWTALWNPMALGRALADTLRVAGPVRVVESACTTGLVAIAAGIRLLRSGEARRVLVLAVDALDEFLFAGFASLRALDRRPCRPFSTDRSGLNLGEAAAAIVLALDDPPPGREQPGEPLAHVLGYGQASDAHHLTAPCRTGSGLSSAMRQALASAGLGPATIDAVNAHGTGTQYNDEMEALALRATFASDVPPVMSFKGAMGHTMGAAGLVETVLCIEALRTGLIAPVIGNADNGVSVPLPIVRTARRAERLDRILTLKSGFGGVNAALVLGRAEVAS